MCRPFSGRRKLKPEKPTATLSPKAFPRGRDWVKSDERILGDSDFVSCVLRHADEHMEKGCRLKSKGVTFTDVAGRVARVMRLLPEVVWEKSRCPQFVRARSLLCYWAARELGMSMTEIANRLGLSQPAVSIAVRRGEDIAKHTGYLLLNE